MMEAEGSSSKAQAIVENDWPQLEELPRPFDVVGKDLLALGALSIDDFLSNAVTTFSAVDISFHLQIPDPPLPDKDSTPPKVVDDSEVSKPTSGKSAKAMVPMLRTAARSMFGSSDCLNFEYLEDDDTKTKQCILTITRPNGTTRSYKSSTGFSRKSEAKAQAAQIAIDMGALDFITSGDADALKAKKGLLLNPFDVVIDNMESDDTPAEPKPKDLPEQEPITRIENSCNEWRAGKVKPHWVSYNDAKDKKKHGAALRIALNAHVFRAYSVDPIYDSIRAAKIACAKLALDQDVIDFIQFGNGQLEPSKIVDDGLDSEMNAPWDSPPPVKGVTLQEYYESLPQPFPEDVGEQAAAEINAPAWLNLQLQSARGGRLVSSFTPVVDNARHLYGCILRIERPEETKTYLIDPQFPKRSDAKSAVCLLAMSQGVGNYIRGLKEEAENKLPADKRKLANEKLLQVLSLECAKIRQGNRLNFIFHSERDAFGCTVKADVSADISKPDFREYTVPTEYKSKADAKAAVAFMAAEQGLVDLLRFRGHTPPPDYVPFWEAQAFGDGDGYVPKRKELDRGLDGEARDRRKRRRGNKDNVSDSSEAPSAPQGTTNKLPGSSSLPPKPVTAPGSFGSNSRWKKSHATGSRGLGQANAYAPASRAVGQDRSGNRSGGAFHHSRDYRYSNASAPSARSSYDHHPPARPHDDRVDYRSASSYEPGPSYSQPDPYGNAYPPPYPPAPTQGHYNSPAPAPVYHSPAPPPPPHHHYPVYYGAPSPAPPPPHDPYGHYAYPPSHYPQQYPQPAYSGPYSSHPPSVYSPPPPPPAAHDYPPVHAANGAPDMYASRYHRYSPSPPPPHFMPSPRHGYHASHPSHPTNHHSYGSNRQGPEYRRRHSSVNDSRPRVSNGSNVNGYRPPDVSERERHYKRKTPPQETAPREREWQRNGQHGTAAQPRTYPEELVPVAAVKKEPDLPAAPPVYPMPNVSVRATASTPKTSLDELFEFCAKEKIPKPSFFSEMVEEKDGSKKYTVWAEKDSQRLELQNHFVTVEEGYEKLSSKVLQWERSRQKRV